MSPVFTENRTIFAHDNCNTNHHPADTIYEKSAGIEMNDRKIDFVNLLSVRNREDLRTWLSENHNTQKECWVVAKRGRPVDDGTLWYVDAVEEAMCFGWIDSIIKKMENGVTVQKLVPRRKDSQWSELNKERCRRMEKMGRMTDAGRALLPDMSESGFVIDPDILAALQADSEAWTHFQKFPPLYQRVRIDTIQIKKKQPELFRSRLEKLLQNSKKNRMYGEWNDNGRLLRENLASENRK